MANVAWRCGNWLPIAPIESCEHKMSSGQPWKRLSKKAKFLLEVIMFIVQSGALGLPVTQQRAYISAIIKIIGDGQQAAIARQKGMIVIRLIAQFRNLGSLPALAAILRQRGPDRSIGEIEDHHAVLSIQEPHHSKWAIRAGKQMFAIF